MERPRALPHPGRPLGQAHPLGTLEGPGTPDPGLAGHARRGLPAQPPPLQGVPALPRVAAALPARGPRARAGAPRRLAALSLTVTPETVRARRPHAAPPPRR